MKILIADDHELVRDLLSAFLEREESTEVDTVSSFSEACDMIDKSGPYDVVLLDYTMPGMNSLAGLKTAMERNSGKPVALISGTASKDVAQEALAAGAAGFLPKSMAAKSFVHAVRFMAAGEQFAPIQFMTAEDEDEHPFAEKLSNRERQVLERLCRGLPNKEIARELDLQEVTVKLHVKTLCRKLDARNRTHAAMIAKEAGFS